MNINFEYYKIFYYVAKYHNFTKAAQVLESSQPNVTRAMNCLEQQMHSTLFVRTNRGVQLTPEGEKLYMYVGSYASVINGRGRTGGLFGHGTWKYIDRSQRDSVKYIFV